MKGSRWIARKGLLFALSLAFGLFPMALAGPVAVLVVDERVLEGGRVEHYIGTQRFPIASEAELSPLLDRLSRPPRPARFIYCRERGWIAVQKFGYRFDPGMVLQAYRDAVEQGRREFVLPVEKEEPEPSVEDLARRGIVELFGEARIGFARSAPGRAHNLKGTSKNSPPAYLWMNCFKRTGWGKIALC